VLLRNATKPVPACREASAAVQDCVACVGAMAAQFRQGWLRAIGAPDYRAYLAHLARRHPGTPPMSERDYARMFIEHRFNRRGGGFRCC
jgi:uncharacterized short protein YbdD (DUF466 family)